MGLLTRLLICLALLPFALSPAAAQGTVEGTLEMNGETVPITHVYAREAIAPASSDAPGHVIIMMTDRPAPPELRASLKRLAQRLQAA